jgi:prephenate dehydrogenase
MESVEKTPLTISTVAIVGHGLIGGSIALAVRSRAHGIRVIPLDRDDSLSAAAEADLVILSAPVRANIENLRTLRPVISSRTLITDTGSTKVGIVSQAAGMRFIGGHPVAGATTSGAESARPDLFNGRRWILTPGDGGTQEDVNVLSAFVESLGAVPQTMDADEHDRLFAYLSHLPQLTISALMHVIGEAVGRDGLAFAGPGLHDSSRLASSAPTMWRDILADNHTNLAGAIDALIGVLQTLRSDISGDELAHVFESARRARSAIEATEQH